MGEVPGEERSEFLSPVFRQAFQTAGEAPAVGGLREGIGALKQFAGRHEFRQGNGEETPLPGRCHAQLEHVRLVDENAHFDFGEQGRDEADAGDGEPPLEAFVGKGSDERSEPRFFRVEEREERPPQVADDIRFPVRGDVLAFDGDGALFVDQHFPRGVFAPDDVVGVGLRHGGAHFGEGPVEGLQKAPETGSRR